MKRYVIFTLSILMLSGCANAPQLFWDVDDGSGKPDYAKGSGASHADSRVPLDVPPELRQELEVPMPEQVAASDTASGHGSKIDRAHREAVAGTAVTLHQRRYNVSPGPLFSAVVDAMTALNLPVDSVDSPSGTLTTEWVRKNANSVNAYVDVVTGMFGGGPTHTRYRYVVRVLRVSDHESQLEIRTLGQQFINKHWVNKPLKINLTEELFSAVEERIPRAEKKPEPSVQPVASEPVPASEPDSGDSIK
ncbi:MAG: hypothetical protein ACE5DZ_01210 [Mariprofundus sp.]